MRAVALALALLIGVGLYSDLTWRKRHYERELRKRVESIDHFVDVGVELRTVVADPNGEELLEGKPRLRILRTHRAGGILDTQQGRLVAPSQRRTIWYCSEDQEPTILHADTDPLGVQVVGSEGAGKTTILPQWHYFRWLEHLGEHREGGQTAPTRRRLAMFLRELHNLYPRGWYWYIKSEQLVILADGTRLQLVSTHQQSEDEGSPLQGYSWSWAGGDEMQDQLQRAADHEARGRAAKRGRYKQCRTATPKDSPAWRDYRDRLKTARNATGNLLWQLRMMLGTNSPFVPGEHWERARASMTKREFERRVEAKDVGPERQLYHTWKRGESGDFDCNVRMVPLGAVDVTADVLAPWGRNLTLLAGHDPGKLFDVTEILKAYRIPMTSLEQKRRAHLGIPLHEWFVVDEVTTEQSTTDQHVTAVLGRVRERWACQQLDALGRANPDGARMLVRADPYSDSSAGDHPDRTIYTTWRQRGITIHPAAYKSAVDAVKVGRIPKEGRIEMVCRLLCDATGCRRLFVACNDRREPAAPRLVETFEVSERDEIGKAETQKKDRRDLSHWGAALGYALWTLERPRMGQEFAS
jgi:hypothetical protein